jgi:energy-coupling factor transporter ATP-binding protein EcfA2
MLTKGTIALLGETGSGKTTQIGELAKAIFKETGKKTFLAACEDNLDGIDHLEELGILHIERWDRELDIFTWINHVALGEHHTGYTDKGAPIWEKLDKTAYGLWAFDSGTHMAEKEMEKLADDQAKGKNIGGQSSFNIQLGDGSKVASNTQTHYGLAQTHLRGAFGKMQRLPGLVVVTFRLDTAEDDTRGLTMAGPLTAGHAQTNQIPAWFRYTFRIKQEVSHGSKPEHVLFLQTHTDGRIGGYSNARVPLASYEELDLEIRPANLASALNKLQELKEQAKEKDRQELGL